jgi:hypothetical protein
MNGAFLAGSGREHGMGESLAVALEHSKLAHPELSVILSSYRRGVPVTVHAAIGAEIIHQHPAASGAAIGDTSHRDFRRLAAGLDRLHDGGVVLNLGSAVIMPEVFLKALTIARNLNEGRPENFVTCDLDMTRHYRPRVNVVQRPTLHSGKGYEITGHHELMCRCSCGQCWTGSDRSGRGGAHNASESPDDDTNGHRWNSDSCFDLHAGPRPLGAQSLRRIRTHDPDHEVHEQSDDRDLDGHPKHDPQDGEQDSKKTENELEREQAKQREQPDHEDSANHAVSPKQFCPGLRQQEALSFSDRKRVSHASPWLTLG